MVKKTAKKTAAKKLVKRTITFTKKEFDDFIWANCGTIGSFSGTFYKTELYNAWFKKVKQGFRVKFN